MDKECVFDVVVVECLFIRCLVFGAQWNVNVVSSGCGLCGLHGGGGESDWLFYARLTMKF